MEKDIKDIIIPEKSIELIGSYNDYFELLNEFIEYAEGLLSDINDAIRESDHHIIRVMSHSIKGSSANLSLPSLQEAAHKLETASKSHNSTDYKEKYSDLNQQFKILKSTLKENYPRHFLLL